MCVDNLLGGRGYCDSGLNNECLTCDTLSQRIIEVEVTEKKEPMCKISRRNRKYAYACRAWIVSLTISGLCGSVGGTIYKRFIQVSCNEFINEREERIWYKRSFATSSSTNNRANFIKKLIAIRDFLQGKARQRMIDEWVSKVDGRILR